MAEPNAQTQLKTKYNSYQSLEQSAGTLTLVSRQSSKWHNICMCDISAIGVIFLNRVLMLSKQIGTYLSNRMIRFDFSTLLVRVSSQLVTNLQVALLVLSWQDKMVWVIRVPSQVLGVYVKYSSPGHGGWGGCSQIGYFEEEPHGWGKGDSLITGQSQHL